jgi:hypothetical protein
MKAVNTPAAPRNAPAMANAPLPLNLEFSFAIAGVFVCVSGVFGGVALVRAMFVGLDDSGGGGGFETVVVGGGLVGIDLNAAGGSRLVLTLVPIMTSGGTLMAGGGVGSG